MRMVENRDCALSLAKADLPTGPNGLQRTSLQNSQWMHALVNDQTILYNTKGGCQGDQVDMCKLEGARLVMGPVSLAPGQR